MAEKKHWCERVGKIVHDWGLGLGTIAIAFGAFIAAFQAKDVLNEVLQIRTQSKEIKVAVNQISESEKQLKKAVADISQILHNIQAVLINNTARQTVSILPPNPTPQDIQKTLAPLTNPKDLTSPYLTDKAMGEVQKAWSEVSDPEKRESILKKALQIGEPIDRTLDKDG